MQHLKLDDLWLYLIAFVLFLIFLLIIYVIFRCSDRIRPPQKRRKESVLYFNIEENATNSMPNFAEWKGGDLPTYVSQWSFQNECDIDLEWKRQLSLKSHCTECEKLLKEEDEERNHLIVSNEQDSDLSYATAV